MRDRKTWSDSRQTFNKQRWAPGRRTPPTKGAGSASGPVVPPTATCWSGGSGQGFSRRSPNPGESLRMQRERRLETGPLTWVEPGTGDESIHPHRRPARAVAFADEGPLLSRPKAFPGILPGPGEPRGRETEELLTVQLVDSRNLKNHRRIEPHSAAGMSECFHQPSFTRNSEWSGSEQMLGGIGNEDKRDSVAVREISRWLRRSSGEIPILKPTNRPAMFRRPQRFRMPISESSAPRPASTTFSWPKPLGICGSS